MRAASGNEQRQPLAGLCATSSGKGHPPGAVGIVPIAQAWETLSSQLFVRHSSKQMPISKHCCSWEKPAQTCPNHVLSLFFHSDSIIWFYWALATIIWEDEYLSKTQDRKEENNRISKLWFCSEHNEHRNCGTYRETSKSLILTAKLWSSQIPRIHFCSLHSSHSHHHHAAVATHWKLLLLMPRLASCCKFTEIKHKVFPSTTSEELPWPRYFFSCSVWYCSFEKSFRKSRCSCERVADQWVFVPMLQCLSLAFHVPKNPSGLHAIVPHWNFEKSWNFFRFTGKALALGHRWADVKGESYQTGPVPPNCGRKPENMHHGQLLQSKAGGIVHWRSCGVGTHWAIPNVPLEDFINSWESQGTGLLICLFRES